MPSFLYRAASSATEMNPAFSGEDTIRDAPVATALLCSPANETSWSTKLTGYY